MVFDNCQWCLIIGMVIQHKSVVHVHVCTTTGLKGVIVFSESFLSQLVQEPSFYVIPGLSYEGNYKLRSIIGTVRYWVDQ